MAMNRKRNRPDDWGDLEPSPVIHVSELPEHTLEIDLLSVFEQYGSVRDLTMIPQRGQALIEYVDLSSAEKVVRKGSEGAVVVANHRVKVNFSTSKRIIQRPAGGDTDREYTDGPMESRVLLLTVYNAQYPITVDVIHQITSRHGRVLRIVIFRKTHVQAMVEFKSTEDARTAKRHLNGADIYSGCCTLKVEFARPTRLTVSRNDQDTWDFENPNLPDSRRPREGDNRPNASLLGRFDRGHRFENGRPQNGEAFAYPDGFPRQGSVPIGGLNGAIFDQLAIAMHPSFAGAATTEGYGQGRAPTPCVMVYNMDVGQMNCDRLFNLLCLYGNVIRIKFLRTIAGSAMAQMGDTASVDRAIRNLSGVSFLGNQLLIRPSKQMVIVDVPKPFELPDGTPSFRNYTGCRENRYTTAEKASKNRIYPPANTLHYWNCPPNFSTKSLRDIFVECGAEAPARIAAFPSTSERSSSGLVEWNTTADAVAALSFANHYSIPYPEGRFPFILKLSFSNTPAQERGHATAPPRRSGTQNSKKSISATGDDEEYR
ncbi:Heterogeneous nuclear ribonucleoprotein L [Fasciola gigantica]|nr:Heterogeneous nuclear ribonucleoprotein L [Fasciola gigantica]